MTKKIESPLQWTCFRHVSAHKVSCYDCNVQVIKQGALCVDEMLAIEPLRVLIEKHVQNNRSARPLAHFILTHPKCFTGSPGCPPRLRLLLKALSKVSPSIRPSQCTTCASVLRLDRAHVHERPGGFICEKCDAVERHTVCQSCKKVKVIASTNFGGPLCDWCTKGHPANLRRCAKCGEKRRVAQYSGGQAYCQQCYDPPKAPCSKCGRVKRVASRRAPQGIVCGTCYERPKKLCSVCGKIGPIHKAGDDGDVCTTCYRKPKRTCIKCGAVAIGYKRVDGGHLCRVCGRRSSLCAYCKRDDRHIEAALPDGPCCFVCYRRMWVSPGRCILCEELHAIVTSLGFCWKCAGVHVRGKVCASCGAEGLLWNEKQCERCYLCEVASRFFSDAQGRISSQNERVYKSIVATASPEAAIRWLTTSSAARRLRELIARGSNITLGAFDDADSDQSIAFARNLYLGAGAITAVVTDHRDLALWLQKTLQSKKWKDLQPEHQLLVRQFAQWTVFKDFRRLVNRGTSRDLAVRFARRSIAGALEFLLWLSNRDITLKSCEQQDMDVYFDGRSTTWSTKKFIKWCQRRRHIPHLRMPKRELGQPLIANEEYRLMVISRLLNDTALPLYVRVAGLLVAMYGQMFGRLRMLKKVDITRDSETGQISIVGGRAQPLTLEDPIGQLLWELRCMAAPHTGIASGVPNPWLFPGHQPGKQITSGTFQRACRRLGIDLRALRGAALTDMASVVDLTMVSEMLDLCTDSAYRWWKIAGGDSTEYVSLRGG